MVVAKTMTGRGLERYWERVGGGRRRFVDKAFADFAADYDWLVRVFSCGLDRRWRQKCVDACGLERSGWVLDCATGTGALALVAARRTGVTERVVGMDPCGPMLAKARKRAAEASARLAWIQADVEHLPLRPDTIATVTLGFALRHMDMRKTLREMNRVLVPGGRVAILEFLRPPSGLASALGLAYLRWIAPPLAGLLAWSRPVWTLAAYLPETIETGPSVGELIDAVHDNGLHLIRIEPLFARLVWLVLVAKPRSRSDENSREGWHE
jgi:demethylmenaquinone methyltransferase/2-methoxy-6-polyprenyl-1,4-benzoquinol methylase